VRDAQVVAFTDFQARIGASGKTDASGNCRLSLAGAKIDRLYIYPPAGYWGGFRRNLATGAAITVPLAPADITQPDIVRDIYGTSRFDADSGVIVGVIDTGCGPHRDLNIIDARTFATGDPNQDPADIDIHGTHVAGLIGARGGPGALRGVAPGVAIRSYRVFPSSGEGASNFDVMNAIEAAAEDGCDIINLSLGGGPYDPAIAKAVVRANTFGALVVAAAGNGGRSAVSYPAAYPEVVAVSAMGRVGSFPAGSVDEGDILRPPFSAADPREFIAAFSNIGREIDATGPGVATLSTLPGDRYGPLSGTSMASPAVAGAAACLMSRDLGILSMPRNATRATMIRNLLIDSCTKRGFGVIFEGAGLPGA
jgi:subtilisin